LIYLVILTELSRMLLKGFEELHTSICPLLLYLSHHDLHF
jgi:hypothetical protein